MMAANGLFIVPLPKKQPYDFIVAQNSKAIVTTINTKAENFKESFEMWFSAQKDRSMHIIFLNAGWQCMVVGYRASSKYGRFIQIKYGTDSIEFCSIYEGKFNWQTT